MPRSEISQAISEIVRREMDDFGELILRKQCQDMGIPYDSIEIEDLPNLAMKLSGALSSFCGKDKSRRIYDEIKRLGNINAIIDKEVNIPDGSKIGYDLAQDKKKFDVTTSGIVIVAKKSLV